MDAGLNIAVRRERGCAIVAVTGEVDISTVAGLRERLYELAESGQQLIVDPETAVADRGGPADRAGRLPGRGAGVRDGFSGRLLARGAQVGPLPVLPDELARLREDAALPPLDVDGTEPHRAGGVEEAAVARFQDGEAGPPQGRVEGEFPRAP